MLNKQRFPTDEPVQFLGSTTGPKFSAQACSPYQVTWSVRPQCAKLDINSVGKWCKNNVLKEDHAHGVRKLVDDPRNVNALSHAKKKLKWLAERCHLAWRY